MNRNSPEIYDTTSVTILMFSEYALAWKSNALCESIVDLASVVS